MSNQLGEGEVEKGENDVLDFVGALEWCAWTLFQPRTHLVEGLYLDAFRAGVLAEGMK